MTQYISLRLSVNGTDFWMESIPKEDFNAFQIAVAEGAWWHFNHVSGYMAVKLDRLAFYEVM